MLIEQSASLRGDGAGVLLHNSVSTFNGTVPLKAGRMAYFMFWVFRPQLKTKPNPCSWIRGETLEERETLGSPQSQRATSPANGKVTERGANPGLGGWMAHLWLGLTNPENLKRNHLFSIS